MSHRRYGISIAEPSEAQIKTTINQVIPGLLRRSGIAPDEARRLCRKLQNGEPRQQREALNRVNELIEKFPSPRKTERKRGNRVSRGW